MGAKREKGKIPRDEWPNIVARHNSGESMASIARTYGCTAPAIRYIVNRSSVASEGVPRRVGGAELLASDLALASVPSSRSAEVVETSARRSADRHILGSELRRRVTGDVASFLVALDQVVIDGSLASIATLEEATDRLMRSTARTRLELERLRLERESTRAKAGREKSQVKGLDRSVV
jgi:hypothetical protein